MAYTCSKRPDQPLLERGRLTEDSFRFKENLRTKHCGRPATFETRIVHCTRKSSQVEREVSLKGFKPMATQPRPDNPALPFPPGSQRLLNSREVADWLGVSIDWVQAHATRRSPHIPAVRLGPGPKGRQMLRFRRADIEKFIADHVNGPSSLRRCK